MGPRRTALAALLAVVAAPVAAGELEDRLDASVGALSAYVPFQIDLNTRLTGISRDDRTLVYDYLVERIPPAAFERHAAVLARRTCAIEALESLLRLGGSVRYAYRFKGTDDQVVHEVTHAACRPAELAL